MNFPETIDLPQGATGDNDLPRPAPHVKANNSDEQDDEIDALLDVNKSMSFDTTTDTSEYWLDEEKLRTQLWDAYRLARVILGKTITKFNLSSSTILHAIRVVAEMKLELIGLHKQVEFYNQKNNSDAISTTTATVTTTSVSTGGSPGIEVEISSQPVSGETALQQQIEKLQEQLTLQLRKYEQLDKTHQDFVQDTKQQLQEVFVQLHSLPKSTVSESQANDIQVTLQKLIHTVAVATMKPQMDNLQTELQMSQQEAKQLNKEVQKLCHEMLEQSQLAELKLETVQSQYEHELALCRDQIMVYKEQVAKQEEELVYSHQKLDEFVKNATGSHPHHGKSGAKILSPSAPRSVVTTDQDKELQKLLINLETVVPGLVKSAKKKFKANKARAAAQAGENELGISPSTSSSITKTNSLESTDSDVGAHPPQSISVKGDGKLNAGTMATSGRPRRPGADEDDDKEVFGTKVGADQKEGGAEDSHGGDQSAFSNEDEKELETSLELQKQVTLLLQQVAVQQTTRRVNELKAEIEVAQEEKEEEDEELIHLKKQLELLEEETHYMTKAQFQKELKFWQNKRIYYERKLAELKRLDNKKREIMELTKKCDELATLTVEMEEFEIIKHNEEEGIGPMFQLVQARQEACANGVSRLRSQLKDVVGDYHDFCHAVEHSLIELDAASWLFSDVQGADDEGQNAIDNANTALDIGDEEKKDSVTATESEDRGDGNEDFSQLQSDVRTANKILQLEMELKRRDQQLAMAQAKLSISDRRISELEQQVLNNLGMPSWDSNDGDY